MKKEKEKVNKMLIVVFAKENIDVHKIWAETVHEKIKYNGEVRYANNIADLQAIISEYSTDQYQEPILLLIGKYLPIDKNDHKIMTNFLIKQAKKRKKCIVMLLTSDKNDFDIENLVLPEMNFIEFYQLYEQLLSDERVEQLISQKNILIIKKKLKKYIKKIRKENSNNVNIVKTGS